MSRMYMYAHTASTLTLGTIDHTQSITIDQIDSPYPNKPHFKKSTQSILHTAIRTPAPMIGASALRTHIAAIYMHVYP